ncbi:MAG: F0F1 ATP synthase subunit gamma [Candidatus Roizmanbacteria bacterium]
MLNKKRVREEIDYTNTLKMIVQAYEEIAVMKMQRVRKSVISARSFMESIVEVFADVKSSYRRKILEIMKRNKNQGKNTFSTIVKNGKNANVFLSANAKLYGDIITKVFREFQKHIDEDVDLVVVGKLGRDLMHEYGVKKQFLYFDMPDDAVSLENLKPVIYHLINYEKINVFYGKFESIVNQEASVANVTGDQAIDFRQDTKATNEFLYEPSLNKLMNFFETQVFTSLFRQTASEFQLARYASRIKSMEDILVNIDNHGRQLKQEERRVKRAIGNKKQYEVVAGINLWSN